MNIYYLVVLIALVFECEGYYITNNLRQIHPRSRSTTGGSALTSLSKNIQSLYLSRVTSLNYVTAYTAGVETIASQVRIQRI
jgi:hypothetical protein